MGKTSSLVKKLARDYPDINFQASNDTYWSSKEQSIYMDDQCDTYILLHELAHASLQHADHSSDAALLRMEQEAWQHAIEELAPRYGLTIPEDVVDDHLESYREWLHARSKCPHCSQTGVQTDQKKYRCIACSNEWHTNTAKRTELRRYATKKHL